MVFFIIYECAYKASHAKFTWFYFKERIQNRSLFFYIFVGTVDYVAPEVLNYEPIGLYTDVWSIGVLAYVLLSGFSPFGADDRQETFLNISKCMLSFEPEHFEDVSSAAIDFIKTALVVDIR